MLKNLKTLYLSTQWIQLQNLDINRCQFEPRSKLYTICLTFASWCYCQKCTTTFNYRSQVTLTSNTFYSLETYLIKTMKFAKGLLKITQKITPEDSIYLTRINPYRCVTDTHLRNVLCKTLLFWHLTLLYPLAPKNDYCHCQKTSNDSQTRDSKV